MTRGTVPFRDADIRAALHSRLSAGSGAGDDTVLIHELGLCRGRVRIDLAAVNGTFHGYEIKSDADSFRRLALQVQVYGRVLDRATLVVGQRHLAKALDAVPSWWGVMQALPGATGPRFEVRRRGRRNPNREPRALVELLWLESAMALLEERDAARGVRGKPRRVVWDRVCASFELDEIAAAVRGQLKSSLRRQTFDCRRDVVDRSDTTPGRR